MSKENINDPLGKTAGADSWSENLESSAPVRIKLGRYKNGKSKNLSIL